MQEPQRLPAGPALSTHTAFLAKPAAKHSSKASCMVTLKHMSVLPHLLLACQVGAAVQSPALAAAAAQFQLLLLPQLQLLLFAFVWWELPLLPPPGLHPAAAAAALPHGSLQTAGSHT
jgi:hypothetical protein